MMISREQQAGDDLRAAREGLAAARRAEMTAERAWKRAAAAWITGGPIEVVEEAEQGLDEARRLRSRVEAAEEHLRPLAPARLAGS